MITYLKNKAKYLPKVFEHLIALKKCFDKYKIIFVYDNNPAKYPEALGIFTVDVTPFDLFSLIACEKGLKASLGSYQALYVSERISIVSG